MKINNVASSVNNNLISHTNVGATQSRLQKYDPFAAENSKQNSQSDKLRIPENYQSKRINLASNVNGQERAYFEEMYPMQKNLIRAYLDQNEYERPEKGQYVDLRR